MTTNVENRSVQNTVWKLTWPKRAWGSFRRWRIDRIDGGSASRLEATLLVFKEELKALHQIPMKEACNCPNWHEHAANLMQIGWNALETGNTSLGWRCFNAARRLSFYSLGTAQLQIEAQGILNEAKEKSLSGWRKQTIIRMLSGCNSDVQSGGLDPDIVIRAARILDEHHENVHRKRAILTERLATLSVASTLLMAVWIWMSPALGALDGVLAERGEDLRTFWITVILAGLIGALISGFTESIKQDGRIKSRVPDELTNSIITYARLALASLSAIAVILFLGSGLFNFASEISQELALVVALLAGFSERLLIRAVKPWLEEPAVKGTAEEPAS